MKRTMRVLMVAVALTTGVFAQGTSINTSGTVADTSAMLDVSSTIKGVLIPRMTASQRSVISLPATGLLVYQIDGTAGFYYNSGTPGAPSWTFIQNSTNTNVTLQGNTFNGASQLVQLNGSSQLPAVSGVNLTNLNATNLASGSISTARLPGGATNGASELVQLNASTQLPAVSGANLTNLPAGNLTGTLPALSGANLTSLPAANLTGTLPAVSGANLTNLNATNIASGTVNTARLGSGSPSSTTFLRGDGTWNSPVGCTWFNAVGNPLAATLNYFGLSSGSNAAFTTVAQIMPVACTFDVIYLGTLQTQAGSGDAITLTLYVNSVAQSLSTTVTSVFNTVVSGGSTGGPVSVVAGDYVAIGITQTNSTPLVNLKIAVHAR